MTSMSQKRMSCGKIRVINRTKKEKKSMKKIFYILMSAVVALGAVACENTFNDNLDTNNKVSITVVIDETTKVALGELEEGLGQKVKFELNDELLVNRGSGSTENYYFTCTEVNGDEYTFTCEAEGVSSIKDHYLYFYYQGGRKGVADLFGNKEDMTIKGAFLKGEGTLTGSGSIKMKMAPLLKLKSAYPVTVTASDWVFNGYKTITTAGGDEWVYISTHTARTVTITASIKNEPAYVKGTGQATGEKELAMQYNKIYNLGELDAKPEEVADGDPAGIEITIDGVFTDWNNITKNVATDASSTMKTVKAYADANNIYVYAEMKPTSPTVHFGVFLDLDADPATGGKYNNNGITRSGEAQIQAQCIYNSAIVEYKWGGNYTYNSDGTQLGTFTFTGAKPVRTDDGSMYVELAIPFDQIPELKSKNIGVIAYVQDNYATSGMLPADGYLVIPAVE